MTNDLDRPLSPVHMRMDVLRTLDVVTIHSLAQSSTGTVTAYKLVLGRCLLAMDESKGYREYGCSNTVSYASNRLGISAREARTCRRVAKRLLNLPLLTLEAEQGQIDWCKLREISSKASRETEALWSELARKHTYEVIESLVGKTPEGALPGDVDTKGESYLSELRCRLSPQVFQMLAQARRLYSVEREEVVTNAVILEWALASYISQQPLDEEALEKVRKEADKDLQAERAREVPVVMEARELAAEIGIFTDETTRVSQESRCELEKQTSKNLEMSRLSQESECELEVHNAQNLEISRVGQASERDRRLDESGKHETGGFTTNNSKMSRAGRKIDCGCEGLDINEAALEIDCGCDELNTYDPKMSRAGRNPDLEALLSQAIGGPTSWQNHLLRFNPDSRLPTRAQRKEILRRDGYRCRTPGCQNRAWFHIHHVTHYADGGKTVAGNLLCLCSGCHRNHHNGYLKIQVENGELVFRDRKGRRLDREAHIELASWVDFRLGWGGEEYDCYRRRYHTGDWSVPSYSPGPLTSISSSHVDLRDL